MITIMSPGFVDYCEYDEVSFEGREGEYATLATPKYRLTFSRSEFILFKARVLVSLLQTRRDPYASFNFRKQERRFGYFHYDESWYIYVVVSHECKENDSWRILGGEDAVLLMGKREEQMLLWMKIRVFEEKLNM
jgi:hypothetical protein